MVSVVAITGDRRTGKTELLLALAEKLIRAGQNVLYVSRTMADSRQAMFRMERDLYFSEDHTVFRGEGNERIVHNGTGCYILFASERSERGRGHCIDTLMVDDGVVYEFPARFVYRAELPS